MTSHISCRSLKQIEIEIPRWRTNGGRARLWLYLKRLYLMSSVIAFRGMPAYTLGFLVLLKYGDSNFDLVNFFSKSVSLLLYLHLSLI